MAENIKKIGTNSYALHLNDGRVFTLSNRAGDDMTAMIWGVSDQSWEAFPYTVGGKRVIPYGRDNRLPSMLRDVLDSNNLAPGVLDRQLGLIFGQGVYLYRLVFKDGQILREWIQDKDVDDWLKSWDVVSYAKGALTDYLHLKGFFNAYYLNRGARIGNKPTIAALEHIPAKNARLGWTDTRDIRDVKTILVGDFENECYRSGVQEYPVYDRRQPGRYPYAASYNHTYSFGRDFYSIPQYWGTLRWIIRGSEIPTIFKYVTDNGLNLAYHIHSPQAYWDKKREIIRNTHPEWASDDAKVEAEIAAMTEKFMKSLTEVLSGKENAGKFFHTVDVIDDMTGKPVTWSIEPIDQKIKDFVESQLKIAEASSSAITSGMGLHPALSNLIINGKLASGSELLYAFKLFLASDTEIPESTVLEPVNQAIMFNFPGKDLRVGFYHRTVQTEEATSTNDRVKNQ